MRSAILNMTGANAQIEESVCFCALRTAMPNHIPLLASP